VWQTFKPELFFRSTRSGRASWTWNGAKQGTWPSVVYVGPSVQTKRLVRGGAFIHKSSIFRMNFIYHKVVMSRKRKRGKDKGCHVEFLSAVFTRTSLKPCFLSPFTLLLASLLSVSRLSLSSLVAGAIKDLRKSNKQWILGKFCGHWVFVCGAELCGKHLRNFVN
jgi:hypothetical protein